MTLLVVACVLYELTQSPAIGSVLVCAKFGWDDLLTARWLWRSDPLPRRRDACFWIYLAWGFWKTAIVAFLNTLTGAYKGTPVVPKAGASHATGPP